MPLCIVQIPCYNESKSLPVTWAALPKTLPTLPGIQLKYLVIDDGSEDDTINVAKSLGVDYILRLPHQGLARTWAQGIEYALKLGADYIINLDADNQYDAQAIPQLLAPLIEGKADIAIGSRDFYSIPHFSRLKCHLQVFGSWVVSKLAGQTVKDATSGYRALTRHAASNLNVFSKYTYTLETILHASNLQFRIINIPIATNEKLRDSRLMRSTASYIRKSLITLTRITLIYKPLVFFWSLALVFAVPAMLLAARFLYYYITAGGAGKIQSLIFMSVLATLAFGCFSLGILAELISTNRRLLERLMARERNR